MRKRRTRSRLGSWVTVSAVLVLAIVSLFAVGDAAVIASGGPFLDDDDNPLEPSIEAVAAAGITTGCAPRKFCPNQATTRAEMAAFLVRALGEQDSLRAYQGLFSDVPKDRWYRPFVERLAELDIVAGYPDGSYRPDAPVSRAEMAALLVRALPDGSGSGAITESFADVPANAWYRPFVQQLYSLGVTVGCDSDPLRYCPHDPVRRDQMAAFLDRAFNFTLPPVGSGVPFGFFMYTGSYDSSLFGTYNGGYISIQPGKAAISRLQDARSNGMRVFVMLAGGSENFQNADGTFSMSKWKRAIDAWAGTNIAPFIADGTIAGHFLIDEPNAAHTWGGKAVPAAQLEEMARYSKVKWPNLVTVVRARPTELQGSGSWQYLDAAWAQYRANQGNVATFAANQSSSAASQGLGLVMGLQGVTGGDGSSGVKAGNKWPGKWAMSAAEIRKYGKALINQSSTCGFVIWRYFDASEWGHWQDPNVRAAVVELRTLASQHAATSCAR